MYKMRRDTCCYCHVSGDNECRAYDGTEKEKNDKGMGSLWQTKSVQIANIANKTIPIITENVIVTYMTAKYIRTAEPVLSLKKNKGVLLMMKKANAKAEITKMDKLIKSLNQKVLRSDWFKCEYCEYTVRMLVRGDVATCSKCGHTMHRL